MKRKLAFVLLLIAITVGAIAPSFAQEPIELEVWVAFSDHRYDWAVDTADRFNALYPEFNVRMVSVGNYDTIVNNYTLAREEDNYPEIVQIFDAALQFAVDTGWFSYAEEIIDGREEVYGQTVDFDDIIPVIADYYTVDGVWAGVAWNTSTPIMYYNVDVLAQAGIEELPTTWADILAACEALQPLVDDGTISACASWPFSGWFIEQWLAQQNEYMVNNENGRAGRATEFNLDTDAYRAIAEFYRELYVNDYFIFEGQDQWGPAIQNFVSGKVAIHMSSSADARTSSEGAAVTGFTLETTPMAYNQDAPSGWAGNILGGATMWISDGLAPEVEEAAMAFLLFFSSTENSASWHTASGYVPVRNSSIELLRNLEPGNQIMWDIPSSSRVDIETDDWYAAFPNYLTASTQLGETTVNNATRGSTYGTFQQSRPYYNGLVEEYMLNGGDLDAMIAETNAKLTELLQEYNFLFADE
jgi:sn-glycerol 3-phosphate transport system substrate-binding protein